MQDMGDSALPWPPCDGGTKAWLGSVLWNSRLSPIPAKEGNRGNTQTSPSLSSKHISLSLLFPTLMTPLCV